MPFWSTECGRCGYRLKFCKCLKIDGRGRTVRAGASKQLSKKEHAERCRKQGYRPL